MIVIKGTLPSLNEYINAERRNRFLAAKMKKEATEFVYYSVLNTPPVQEYPIHAHFVWYTPNNRSDPDNISWAVKFVFDGLQLAGVIRNDGRKEIASITHSFFTDKDSPRVELFM
jgi:hypothetical protein